MECDVHADYGVAECLDRTISCARRRRCDAQTAPQRRHISTPPPSPVSLPHPRSTVSSLTSAVTQLLDCEVHQQFLTVASPPRASPAAAAAVRSAVGRFVRRRRRRVTNGADRKQPIRANTSSRRRSLQISPPSAALQPRRDRLVRPPTRPPASRLFFKS